MNTSRAVDLFDGVTLDGWVVQPRVYGSAWPGGPNVYDNPSLPRGLEEAARRHPASWSVEDGVLIGRQSPPGSGFGGYLVSEQAYDNFELTLEMRPDWPADTGVMIRRRFDSWEGLQVLVDHRTNGSIGGFFGNGIGSFLAAPYTLDRDADGALALSNRAPWSQASADALRASGQPGEFLAAWRDGDWNELRIRCEGVRPRVTTWVNGVFVAEIDLGTLVADHYDADAVAATLGGEGHIALEVHDNDPVLGEQRWAPEAACRWRNIRLMSL